MEEGRFLRFLFVLFCFSFGFDLNLDQAHFSATVSIPKKIFIAQATLVNSTPIYVAVEKGFFKPELDIVLRGFPIGKAALDEVLKGKADMATVTETPFMHAVLNGREVSIMATISETTNSILPIGPER